jgi:hypothetical protein
VSSVVRAHRGRRGAALRAAEREVPDEVAILEEPVEPGLVALVT